MDIKIFGTNNDTKVLFKKVKSCIDELGLTDFIKLEETSDENLKNELSIKKEPALIIEEDSIDFKDTIFEGIVPEEEEIKSMIVSIIGGSDGNNGCSPEGCGSGCSC